MVMEQMDAAASENAAEREKGKNVKIALMFIRHGERTTKGELTDYGRDMTRARVSEVQQDGFLQEEFDVVKPMGSPAGPKKRIAHPGAKENERPSAQAMDMGRSVETAHIFGAELAKKQGYRLLRTRNNPALSYETKKNPMPYNHTEIYNSLLPENFNELSDEEKAKAAKQAQIGAVNHLMELDTPEAKAYKQEVAGAYAYTILHNAGMTKKLNSGSKVFIPEGVHSPMVEVFLQKALIRKNKEGQEITGFKDIEEIGGEFDPSEGFLVNVETDDKGNLKPLSVSFTHKNRPEAGSTHFDLEMLKDLADHYRELHKS